MKPTKTMLKTILYTTLFIASATVSSCGLASSNMGSNVGERGELLPKPFFLEKPQYFITTQHTTVTEDVLDEPEQVEVTEPQIPQYNVPLSDDLQKYIWELSQEYDVSYELILAVIKLESNFDANAVSYNNTSRGLMQINTINTIQWLSSKTNIKNPDPFNPYHSAKMGVWYLDFLRDYWIKKGYSEELAFNMSLLSFNRGIQGSINYVKEHGYSHVYVDRVFEYKTQLERDGEFLE